LSYSRHVSGKTFSYLVAEPHPTVPRAADPGAALRVGAALCLSESAKVTETLVAIPAAVDWAAVVPVAVVLALV
jgi:hypothetical protein